MRAALLDRIDEARIVLARLKAGQTGNQPLKAAEEMNSRQRPIEPSCSDAVILEVRRLVMPAMIGSAQQKPFRLQPRNCARRIRHMRPLMNLIRRPGDNAGG